ncbi:esterase/lipase family protein [Paucibacter sp. KCTC 42545]|uniref:esterase/lipase family protein n=1 Tax=Paucibacter sp. KCTC 42545 TaxID=1768242 RepID=UPI000A96D3D0|nr:GPI inositol-deacylase [Paucibacter sp. KCTC 42545]
MSTAKPERAPKPTDMPTQKPKQRRSSIARHWQASDARALSQLAVQATLGVTEMVEGVHQSVWRRLGLAKPEQPQASGISGLVFRSVKGGTKLVGLGLDMMLRGLEPWLVQSLAGPVSSPEREAVLAALNGVMGDHLQASSNTLATPMSLRWQGQVLQEAPQSWPAAAAVQGKVLLLLHGLCMNDLQWRPPGDKQLHGGHAQALCDAGGMTPVFLRYNSGLHISQNGHLLASQLELLCRRWPRAIDELQVLAHSMGGLLLRSAYQSALSQGMLWPARLSRVYFLGTPHHGAPLERAGNWIDVLLGSSSHSAPFAKLGQLRSAGITDLRYGNLLDSDWHGQERFARRPDQREHLPLPARVDCFAIAATTAAKRSPLAERLIGDGLVPLSSALGEHEDPARCLHFAPERQWIAFRTGHLALLHDPAVTKQLLLWQG